MSTSALTRLYSQLPELLCLLAWAMLLLPSLIYLFTTWTAERNRLFARLSPRAIKLYYEQFRPALLESFDIDNADDVAIGKHFEKFFGRRYGKRHYVLPLSLLAIVSGVGLWGTANTLQAWLGAEGYAKPFPPLVVSAFLGAYAWVLYDQLSRYRAADFTTHDVYSCVYRFLIAIPLGLSFAAVVKDEVGVAVAFFLSAFPTKTLFKYSRRLSNNFLNLGESEEGMPSELAQLQGIGKTNAERYYDEGITSIAELAWADPIDLMIKTNREFSLVIDSVSQALLWVYLEEKVKVLYCLSLRGAQEVCSLLDDLKSRKQDVKSAAEATLATAAARVGLDKESFRFTLLVVREDPYTQFLYAVWN